MDRRSGQLWSQLEMSPSDIEKLHLLSHNPLQIKEAGYITEPLSDDLILAKIRCLNCGMRCKTRSSRKKNNKSQTHTGTNLKVITSATTPFGLDDSLKPPPMVVQPTSSKCTFHPERAVNKVFACCGRHVSTGGCVTLTAHMPEYGSVTQPLKAYWMYHQQPITTPPPARISHGRRLKHKSQHIRKAVALDCEMGVSQSGETELIKLTVVDFFTGEILIDSLVWPDTPMAHYNTRYSGVTFRAMREAVRHRTCIFGRDAARQQIWRFVDPRTTAVVMHGGHNDLSALRWIHPFVVDTQLVQNLWGKENGGHSLKNLCEKKLGISIQKGNKGHCSLEDTLACRELLIWFMRCIPDAVAKL